MPIAGALAASVAVGYALGSIPWAYVSARLKGVDIVNVDTGIAGAANVYRRLGWALGVGVFIGDAAKAQRQWRWVRTERSRCQLWVRRS